MDQVEAIRAEKWASSYRKETPAAARWAAGYGPVQHSIETQERIFRMAEMVKLQGVTGDGVPFFELLQALDRLTCAALWLVVHETYAHKVYLDGRDLSPEDFKTVPEGHTGGALNIVPAYAGYMAVNALTGLTRSWMMGQGHCVAAVDSINLLLDNQSKAHAARYSLSDEGLTRFVNDFYSYRLTPTGEIESPLGSHVNAYTAGGISEGGYLGFASLEYVHMPLRGERLVCFLSDGAFEEQRGSDWAPRWWRAEDSGLVAPIMIDNQRSIDKRTQIGQDTTGEWFAKHLTNNGFDPFIFDGRDPAAFAWAIWEMESRLEAATEAIRAKKATYPIALPYGIAVAPKGAGFYGEGTIDAHNLPLITNPHTDIMATRNFNESARRVWVPSVQLQEVVEKFQHHSVSGRVRERDHALANRQVRLQEVPAPVSVPTSEDRMNPQSWPRRSPMAAVDTMYLATVQANPQLRPRVGNPDEMRSNRMIKTLEALNFRVTNPEHGAAESIFGAVIGALNEEAVVCATLANKGGINIAVSYEAFAAKMQGAMRQHIIWSNHANERGIPQGWLSIPIVVTSHTWENGKNEQSHQDPALAEAMLGEPSDVSRVIFPADYNSAAAVMQTIYQTHGQIWTLVVPKLDSVPVVLTAEESALLVRQGAIRLEWAGHDVPHQQLVLTAVGAYQLEEVLKASMRLKERQVAHSVVYMLEPGRFREPRGRGEQLHAAPAKLRADLYPDSAQARIFVTHTRPEPLLGALQPLNSGSGQTVVLGFINHGGTLNVQGLLTINRCSTTHILAQAARLLEMPREDLLTGADLTLLGGKATMQTVPA
ncbi:MAG: xylulose 5-phosphate 3-epimerase [Dehalococcoidia bacterium]